LGIGFSLDVFVLCGVASHQAVIACARSIVFTDVANASVRPPRFSLRPLGWIGMAFGMPEPDLSRFGKGRRAENMGNLTFWHLACQKSDRY
jgi:hypothetical protein